MHVGVTGASGFIGQNLSEHLAKDGSEVTAFVRRIESVPNTVAARVQHLELTSDKPIDGRPGDIECLVHLAGLAHDKATDSRGNRASIYDEINAAASIRVAEDAARLKVRRFVYLSSISVFGHALLSSGREIREEDHPVPSDPYGESKLKAETGLLKVAETSGMELVIVRPALVVGPQAPGNLETLCRLIRSGYPIPVGRPPNERSYIGLSDLSQLLVNCISSPAAPGQVFLAADPARLNTEYVVRRIAKGMGKSPLIVPMPRAVARFAGRISGRGTMVEKIVGDLRINSTKAMKLLQWRPSDGLPDEFTALGRGFDRGR